MTVSSAMTLGSQCITAEQQMQSPQPTIFTKRYDIVSEQKSGGAVYTPKILADFVSKQIAEAVQDTLTEHSLCILDPAIGHGELLVSLIERLSLQQNYKIEVYGFETDPYALNTARKRLEQQFPEVSVHFELGSFLSFVLENDRENGHANLFRPSFPQAFDFVIANPPYVRTQIIGAKQAQQISAQFGLSGRIDLYYAFVLGISQVLKPEGIAGIIVSNRFMTTKSGAPVRRALFEQFTIRHAWDLGDTKLFEAAVLPAVLLVQGKTDAS